MVVVMEKVVMEKEKSWMSMDMIDIGSRNLVVEEIVSFLAALIFLLLKNKLDLPASASVSLMVSNTSCCFNDELLLALLQSMTIYIAIAAAFMAAIID
jgi:hypothetical protein